LTILHQKKQKGPIMSDNVNRPQHYTQGKIEVIDFILDQKMNFLEGNVIKYVSRYKFKNGIEDLKKAAFYLNKLIEELNGQDQGKES
jgi:hypothetical protein